ncbi:MAG: hypothetical protein P8Z37_10570 [Acidobacteriota bacterium]
MRLSEANFDFIVSSVSKTPRTLTTLISLTCSDELLICWRAIDAIGRCAEELSGTRPEICRKYLRRLFWMMSDESGSFAPHAPEVIGEIVQSNPKEFEDFIPLTISLLDLEPEDLPAFLPGILYALGRIGEAAPGSVVEALRCIELYLRASDPQTRAMSILSLYRLGCRDVLLRYSELESDPGRTQIYAEAHIRETTVSRIYRDAMAS